MKQKLKMDIQHEQGTDQGQFFIVKDGDRIASIVYSRSGDNLIIQHTEVDESLRGEKVGYDLVYRTVEFARTSGLKIFPMCTFAKAVFNRHPDWGDVLA